MAAFYQSGALMRLRFMNDLYVLRD